MAIIGSVIKRTFEIRESLPKIRKRNGYKQQTKTLKKLLSKAEFTAFGEHYNFSKILGEEDLIAAFQQTVKTHDYVSMYKNWWYRTREGEANICWPGKIKYFALSSGTSDAASKYIPVTSDMLKVIRKAVLRQMISFVHVGLPKEHFEKEVLMVGGSTDLKYNGIYYEGDLSGITTGSVPFYVQGYSKPGLRITSVSDWEAKLQEITNNASKWDIGIVCGVPAWIQILFEKIIREYKVANIHEIWPNLNVYIHGGVSFAPYKKGFDKLLGRPIVYMDTYLASEGYVAFQTRQETDGMKMMLDNGLFYEFVPFTPENFDDEGNMGEHPQTLHIDQVREGVEYALLITTCSGAWRYLIGDVIKFTSVEQHEIIIVGRTKHFLSLCGEHLSQDNMNKAIELVSEELKIDIKEFTVAGISYDTMFAHHWFIGTDGKVDAKLLRTRLDETLKELNDDYKVERISALKDVIVDVYPVQVFYDYMRTKGKVGSQFKFPRVLKKNQLIEWESYLKMKR
ncbi:MAG: GH3 auxin-responsive promoter family protein [Bacteroidia bacterium]